MLNKLVAPAISYLTSVYRLTSTPGEVDPETGRTYITHNEETGYVIDDKLRSVIGTNNNITDNQLIYSWKYIMWMVSYCLFCTVVGVTAIALLPDPETLELIRNRAGTPDYDELNAAAQRVSHSYEIFQEGNGIEVDDSKDGGSYGNLPVNSNQISHLHEIMTGAFGNYQNFEEIPSSNSGKYDKIKKGSGRDTYYDQWMKHYNSQRKYAQVKEPQEVDATGFTSSHFQDVRVKRDTNVDSNKKVDDLVDNKQKST